MQESFERGQLSRLCISLHEQLAAFGNADMDNAGFSMTMTGHSSEKTHCISSSLSYTHKTLQILH